MILNTKNQDRFLELLFENIPINEPFNYDELFTKTFDEISPNERKEIFSPVADKLFLSYLENTKIIERINDTQHKLSSNRGFLAKELGSIGEYAAFRHKQLKAEVADYHNKIYWIFRLIVAAIIGAIITIIVGLIL